MTKRHDRGSAVVAAVLCIPMVLLFFVVVVEVSALAYARSTAVHAAAEGARAAAVATLPASAAAQRARTVLSASSQLGHVQAITTTLRSMGGVAMVRVVVRLSVPALWVGPTRLISGSAYAVREVLP